MFITPLFHQVEESKEEEQKSEIRRLFKCTIIVLWLMICVAKLCEMLLSNSDIKYTDVVLRSYISILLFTSIVEKFVTNNAHKSDYSMIIISMIMVTYYLVCFCLEIIFPNKNKIQIEIIVNPLIDCVIIVMYNLVSCLSKKMHMRCA